MTETKTGTKTGQRSPSTDDEGTTAGERACIKCGRPVSRDVSVCDICNRAGMATPSASQYHGTIAVAIIVGVIALGFAASLSVRGMGPFRGEVVGVSGPAAGGVEVSVEVLNEGTRAGRANCRLIAVDATGRRLGTSNALSPSVDGGGVVVFSQQIDGVTVRPESVSVDCS